MDDTEKNSITDYNPTEKTRRKEKLFVQQVQNLDLSARYFYQKKTAWYISSVSARTEA